MSEQLRKRSIPAAERGVSRAARQGVPSTSVAKACSLGLPPCSSGGDGDKAFYSGEGISAQGQVTGLSSLCLYGTFQQ